ncbi:hypothetical protein HXY33_05690 [Candidatus Bathyarchaeota archaeon]|nr:hypothetical protein [Candidatus Bathyarchaeota archaeon]
MTEASENQGIESQKQMFRELLIEITALALLTVSIAMLWRDNMLLFMVVLAECLTMLLVWHERYDLYFFAAIAVLSSLIEAVFVHFQVWQYSNPTFLGVPLWFPIAFGTAALTGQRFVRTLTLMFQ